MQWSGVKARIIRPIVILGSIVAIAVFFNYYEVKIRPVPQEVELESSYDTSDWVSYYNSRGGYCLRHPRSVEPDIFDDPDQEDVTQAKDIFFRLPEPGSTSLRIFSDGFRSRASAPVTPFVQMVWGNLFLDDGLSWTLQRTVTDPGTKLIGYEAHRVLTSPYGFTHLYEPVQVFYMARPWSGIIIIYPLESQLATAIVNTLEMGTYDCQ